MLKPFLLVSLIATSLTATAQTDKGNWMVGGSIGSIGAYHMTGEIEAGGIALSINPSGAYFIRNNFALGTAVQIAPQFSNGNFYLGYGLHPFMRNYFGKKTARPFVQAGGGYYGNRQLSGGTSGTSVITGHVAGGVAYFLTPNVALEGKLSLHATKLLGRDHSHFSQSVAMGFQIYLQSLKRVKTMTSSTAVE